MTSATESEVMIQLNERQIYDLEWLEDCYKNVRFPNPKCEDFLTEINKTLSNKIRGEYIKYLYDRMYCVVCFFIKPCLSAII